MRMDPTRLLTCGSGIELMHKGKEADVHYAAQLDFLSVAPRLHEGIFSNSLASSDRILQ